MESRFRVKTALLLFASLGTGIFLGAVGCLHYDIMSLHHAIFSSYSGDGRSTWNAEMRKQQEDIISQIPSNSLSKENLQHGLSDEELLWQASVVHRRRSIPAKERRIPKVAFMFLTRGPLPLAPLWEYFFATYEEFYSVYVHADPSYTPTTSPFSVFHLRNIPSKRAKWGDVSICDAERRLLANALLDPANERFVLLSESCIPLYNFSYIYAAFTSTFYSYVQAFDDPGVYGRGRYHPRMAPEVTLEQWRKGSQWFEVTRELAVEIVSDTKYYPKFKHFCVSGCYVDEHYIQTMMSLEHGALLMNRTITHTEWVYGRAHPTLFYNRMVTEELLSQIRPYFFFSRKYSPSALKPLLKLAPRVMFISTSS
uniref:Uncharacterized protein n=2 Tax=Physcomitrium patens TaxID=3218 RepID=A0A2K1KEW7_PHYPA|nr:hypothetical protein PHYPA_008692 [Physcomitrium patens]